MDESKSKTKKVQAFDPETGETRTFPLTAWNAMPVDDKGLRYGWQLAESASKSEKPVAQPKAAAKAPAHGDVNKD